MSDDVGMWPVAVVPVGQVSCATTLWRAKGRLSVTVVVKARFSVVHNGTMTPIVPEPVLPQGGETAPYLTQADVVISAATAHPRGSGLVPALAVRLAVFREWAVIDKSLLVYPVDDVGHRAHTVTGRIPVVVPPGAASAPLGILVNPSEASRPGTLAPLAPDSVERMSLLEDRALPVATAGVYEIPAMFPWSYFQVAPPDQRTSFLRGDEWIVLDGMDVELPRIQSRLPRARAEVYVYPPGLSGGSSFRVHMEADRLSIDADRRTCSLLWRGSFPVADETSARSLILVAGVATPTQPVVWPDIPALLRNPILQAHGLVQADARTQRVLPAPRRDLVEEDEESMAATRNVNASDAAALFAELAADVAARTPDDAAVAETVEVMPESVPAAEVAQLEMSSDGVLSVHTLSESVIMEVMQAIGEEEVQAAIDPPAPRRSALGLPRPEARVLKAAHTFPHASESAPPPAARPRQPSEAPKLDEQSVDQLELTLSDALTAQGIPTIDHLPWRQGGGSGGGQNSS